MEGGDADTEGVLARLSRGVDRALTQNAAPPPEDPTSQLLRTLLYEGNLPVSENTLIFLWLRIYQSSIDNWQGLLVV